MNETLGTQFFELLAPDHAEMALVDFTDELVLPASREQETRIHGYPEGSLLNFVSWSDDSRHIAFTIRSAGASPSPARCLMSETCLATESTSHHRSVQAIDGCDQQKQGLETCHAFGIS